MLSRDFLLKVPTFDETGPYFPFFKISCISSQVDKEGIFSKDAVPVTFFLGIDSQNLKARTVCCIQG